MKQLKILFQVNLINKQKEDNKTIWIYLCAAL